MKDYSVPIQSLIDHINTATDVDPWAKKMAADLLAGLYEKDRHTKVEFIESYIKIGNGDYQWNDNHGELIRCKDCKYAVKTSRGEVKYCKFWQADDDDTYSGDALYLDGDFYCAGAEKADEVKQ